MKKRALNVLTKGSAAYVVAHGKWKNSRGRGFSMSFGMIANPKLSHIAAEKVLHCCSIYKVPVEKLNYTGDFVLELTPRADMEIAQQQGASIIGQEVYASGRVVQGVGGIQLYNSEMPFWYGYSLLKAIRKSNGEYLWKNFNYDEMG